MTKDNTTGATIGFEDKLWNAADRLHFNMDATGYEHIVAGLNVDCATGECDATT
jgi:type I restriction-modification system DNA methylase subunit